MHSPNGFALGGLDWPAKCGFTPAPAAGSGSWFEVSLLWIDSDVLKDTVGVIPWQCGARPSHKPLSRHASGAGPVARAYAPLDWPRRRDVYNLPVGAETGSLVPSPGAQHSAGSGRSWT